MHGVMSSMGGRLGGRVEKLQAGIGSTTHIKSLVCVLHKSVTTPAKKIV